METLNRPRRNFYEDGEKKFLSGKVLSELEGFVSKEMEPLDLEEIGESIGISREEMDEDLLDLKSTQDKIKNVNDLALAIKEKKAELRPFEDKEVANYYERMGHVFEGFLYTHIGESKIFKDVILHKASIFDDIKRGVDFVAEYQNPDNPKSYIALAMDASFSMYEKIIKQKIERSLSGVGKKELSKVKYFQFDENADESKVGMPRVVVGVDEDRTRSLLQRWHTEKTADTEVSFSEDPVWTIMALQIKEQLKSFIKEAEYHKQPSLIAICKKYLKALEASLRLNSDLVEKHKSLMEKDRTSIAIVKSLQDFDKERAVSIQQHKDSAQDRRDEAIYQEAIRKK